MFNEQGDLLNQLTHFGMRLNPHIPSLAPTLRGRKIQSLKYQLNTIARAKTLENDTIGTLSDPTKKIVKAILLDLVVTQCNIYSFTRIGSRPSEFGKDLDSIRISLLHLFHQSLKQDAAEAFTQLQAATRAGIAKQYRLKAVAWGCAEAALLPLNQTMTLRNGLTLTPAIHGKYLSHQLRLFNPKENDDRLNQEQAGALESTLMELEKTGIGVIESGSFGAIILLNNQQASAISMGLKQASYASSCPKTPPSAAQQYVVKRSNIPKRNQDQSYFEKHSTNESKVLTHIPAHNNIVKYYGQLTHNFRYYSVLEYCVRGDLFNHTLRTDNSSSATIKKIVADILAGLLHLHKNNVIHCDIKPENILWGDNNTAKITDFDSAQFTMDTCTTCKGTVHYFTPYNAKKYVAGGESGSTFLHTFASDQWAFLMVVYQLTTKNPWPDTRSKETKEIARRITYDQRPLHNKTTQQTLEKFGLNPHSFTAKVKHITAPQQNGNSEAQNDISTTEALSAVLAPNTMS